MFIIIADPVSILQNSGKQSLHAKQQHIKALHSAYWPLKVTPCAGYFAKNSHLRPIGARNGNFLPIAVHKLNHKLRLQFVNGRCAKDWLSVRAPTRQSRLFNDRAHDE